jgi:pyridoxal phosphate enzyme (YggS family)
MVMENFIYLEENLAEILRGIKEMEKKYQRSITLVCVTKSGSDEELLELARLGADNIGENRPSELVRRGGLLREKGYSPVLHQIGHLQRNKVKLVAGVANLIHSLDSISLAEELNKQAEKLGIRVSALIEINSAMEESKGGIAPDEAEEFFLALKKLDHIDVMGIMTMGPALEDKELIRPYFKMTKNIFDKIKSRYGFAGDPILSMGMSESYSIAIEEGANLVRIGRRLFEKRQDKE